jgi:hypothetical protein
MRHLPGGEVFGPERCRAAPLERVVQRRARKELAEQGTVAVDIEVPAHHSRDRDAAYDTGQSSELGTVNRFAGDQSPSVLATGWVLTTDIAGSASRVTSAPVIRALIRVSEGMPGT